MSEQVPFGLSIDYGGDRFPVAGPRPRLSWKVPAAAEPAGFELEADIEGQRNTAVLSSAEHVLVAWPWRPLASTESVAWRVRVLGGAAWSAWHRFEAGLFDEDWGARWISPVEGEPAPKGHRPAYRLATTFEVGEDVVSARLYATALGVYEAFVGGERAGTAELSPGSTSYDRTLYAQASDVTSFIRRGSNLLSILLSDGWYRGQVGAFREPAGWGETLAARAELHLRHADGSRSVVVTDETWTSSLSEVTRADLMDGQTTDYTVGAPDPQGVLVDAVDAPRIDWSPAPPVRVVETRKAVSVVPVAPGRWIADFGQNASGWVTLTDLGPAGSRTVIDYGEHVGPDGDLATAHLDGVRPDARVPFVQRDEVVSSGQPGQVFEPRHTVHGFQYARIERDGVEFDRESVAMRVVHSDLARAGSFECSDDDLNRLHSVAEWSFRGNAVDVPTDCPTRERLGWTGDYQVFAPTAVRLYDVSGFTRKWLRSVRDDQLADGRIANFSPDGRRIKERLDHQLAMMTGSAGWGDAIVAVPWLLYETYGDREALAENWDAMVRWVDWALTTARSARHQSRVERSAEPMPHEEYIWDGSFHWGEWLEPKERAEDGSLIDPVQSNPMAWFMADKGEVGTAYLFRSVHTVASIATVLGRTKDAARYATLAERIRDAWRTEFLDADGRTKAGTQASYVRALAFDLVPGPLQARAAEHLVGLIRAAGNHLGTGFLSTADLLPVLADTGHAEVAYSLLFQRTSPSWLGMLDRGATSIWEDWDGVDEQGNAHESLNHYSKGAVIRFLHTHTLGLRQTPGSVAWESFVVAPVLDEVVTWAKGTFESPHGTIAVDWRLEDDQLSITVDVPAGSSAAVVFPDGERHTAGPGRFVHRRPVAVALAS
ncbi:family 78 glycoside hydrolase catalytic domain [Naasia sp. SYSU D00948]|uniref:alpha-L-rhamnosidase n=1 Tax=Naasia sp. SYSU D00948 TaxID=2817379 RepID=UPI0027DCEE18|nr:family 78 glycoside hydrolase catalytic domain [Naasia sp. SYSU D00948]